MKRLCDGDVKIVRETLRTPYTHHLIRDFSSMIMMLRQQIATSRKGSFPSLLQRAFAKLVERPALKPKYDNYIGIFVYLKLTLTSKMLL